MAAPRARVVECGQDFSGKAIVADAGDGPLDAPFVTGSPHARGVDMKVARLCVLEKRGRDARRQGIGRDDDRLRVIWNQDRENAAEKFPGGFTRLDGAGGGFLEGGIDEAVPRAHRGKDPGPKPSPFPLGQCESAHPPRIDLQFLAGLAIEHRDRRRRLPKL